jgi:predicted Zn-dependent protease
MDGMDGMDGAIGFEGSAFAPDLPGGRGPGTIRVGAGRLRFSSRDDPEKTIELPLRGLEMRLGGASDRLVFFSHADVPEVSVYTSDHGVLDLPELAGEAGTAEQLRRVRAHKARLRWSTAAVLATLVLAVAGLVAAKDPLVAFVAARVPPSVEVRLGDLVFQQVRASKRLIEDAELAARLDELVAPLVAALPETGYPFAFHLAEDGTVNAFALPGGHVVLHSGLVLEAESAEEVLGVLAHEIAHVTRRHSLRQLINTAGVFVLFQAVFGDLTGLAAVVADGGLQLLTLEFSRDHERDADATGFDYLVAAGVDPRGMISFFEKLREEQERLAAEGAGLEVGLGILSTHPATEERIDAMTRRLAETGAPAGDAARAFDFPTFQDMLRGEVARVEDEAGSLD